MTPEPAAQPAPPMQAYGYAFADAEHYAPLYATADAGREFAPTRVPAGWKAARQELWTAWTAAGVERPDEGWKVHVSARLERAQHVLDVVAASCFAERVPFKHLRAELFFIALHHKHGPRPQAGKFCAAYPAGEAAARRLMDRLADALAAEDGPYILSDRRYRDSRTVHYRWGAFRARERLRPDGTRELLARDGHGRDVVDARGTAFALPAGIVDPFAAPDTGHSGPITLHGYEITRVIQPSNAGGTYEGRDPGSGRPVFVKEARAHNGLAWDESSAQERLRREHATLVRLHAAAPGVCPEPLDYFREWEHEFLVTEYVAGTRLDRWLAARAPILQAGRGADDFAAHYAACTRLLAALDAALARLHGAGYRFGDVSPANVLVDDDGGVRLVDFETASPRDEPPVAMGTAGFMLQHGDAGDGPFAGDAHGADGIALALLMPLHEVLQRSPGNLRLLRRDLQERAPVPAALWTRAAAYCERSAGPDDADALPSPLELDGRPRESLEWLAAGVRRGLLATATPEHPAHLFPTVPRGFETNTLCVAYGAAGVLDALRRTGPVPPALVARFRRDALAAADDLPPGLHVGAAGVAWVLADFGLVEEALALLDRAERHPLLAESASLGEGRAGVALAGLAAYRHTGDARLLERAAAHAEALAAAAPADPGLLRGRAGLALALHALAGATGEPRHRAAGRTLLHRELDGALVLPDGALSFAAAGSGRRALPYLHAGSAGVVLALLRYAEDERCAAALPPLLADIDKRCTLHAGLMNGLAGLVLARAEHADWAGGDAGRAGALALATGLVKYAVPHAGGVRVLGEGLHRCSSELWSGGAGVLLALDRVLHGAATHGFSFDRPLRASLAQAA